MPTPQQPQVTEKKSKAPAISQEWEKVTKVWKYLNQDDSATQKKSNEDIAIDLLAFINEINKIIVMQRQDEDYHDKTIKNKCQTTLNLFQDIKSLKITKDTKNSTDSKIETHKINQEISQIHNDTNNINSAIPSKEKQETKIKPNNEPDESVAQHEINTKDTQSAAQTLVKESIPTVSEKIGSNYAAGSDIKKQSKTNYPKKQEFNNKDDDDCIKQLSLMTSSINALKQQLNIISDNLSSKHKENDAREQQNIMLQHIKRLNDRIDSLEMNGSNNTETVNHIKSNIEEIFVKIDGKIDMNDAKKVLELRHEVNRFAESEIIRNVSKKIMPIIAHIKEINLNDQEDISSSIKKLEESCIGAGLLTVDKLF